MNSQPLPSSPAPLSRFMDRRGFLRTSALTSSGIYLATSKNAVAQASDKDRTIKCALVGCGAQGNALRVASKDVPGIQWVAMCDIWEFSIRKTRGGFLGENKAQIEGDIKVYYDINEMLDKEPSIEAVFIATPDFMHAPYSRLCLEKGKNVYCEKMMSNTIEGATDMVRAGKANPGIFQIGHQRHSNPRYLNLRDNVIKPGMLGRITHAYAQWNRGVSGSAPQGAVKGYEIPQDVLTKNGYGSLEEFRNWRFFAKYGGGPLSDLGAHQIDMFNWMYESTPVSVIASGGVDYFDGSAPDRPKFELPDNMMCIYEFNTPAGALRAYYQVLTTTGSQGAYEKHMGIKGTAIISELDTNGNQLYAEPGQDWEAFSLGEHPPIMKAADKAKNKFWEHPRDWEKPKPPSYGPVSVADVRESKALSQWELAVKLKVKPHTPHIANFIEAVQTKNPAHLTCNVEAAFRSCVTVLKAYEAKAAGGKYIFKPEDFQV